MKEFFLKMFTDHSGLSSKRVCGQNQRHIAEFKVHTHIAQKPLCHDKQQHKRHADYDFRIDNRQIGDVHDNGSFPVFHAVNPHRRNSSDDCCNDGRNQRDDQSIDQRLDNQIVVEQFYIPVQRKAGKVGAAFGLIKGKENQNADRGVQKCHNDPNVVR